MGRFEVSSGVSIHSRAELEFELGAIALALARLSSGRRTGIDGVAVWPQTVIDDFLDACVRLLGRTRPAHRAMAIDRLCAMSAAAHLGIIGLHDWLAEQGRSFAVTSDRAKALPSMREAPSRPGASSANHPR